MKVRAGLDKARWKIDSSYETLRPNFRTPRGDDFSIAVPAGSGFDASAGTDAARLRTFKPARHARAFGQYAAAANRRAAFFHERHEHRAFGQPAADRSARAGVERASHYAAGADGAERSARNTGRPAGSRHTACARSAALYAAGRCARHNFYSDIR